MGDADRAVGGVDRLPARTRRTVDVDAQVLLVDLDVDVLGLWKHGDGRRRSVDAAAALGRGHPLHAVHAAFELEPGKDARPGDRGDRFLVSADLGRAGRDQLEAPALRFGEALVHAQQVAGEQRRLIAAGAGADLEHRRAIVDRIARQQPDRQRPLGLRQTVANFIGFARRHLLELGLGGGVGNEAVQDFELGTQPAHLARSGSDRLDRRIILRQPHELFGRKVPARHRLLKLVPARLDRGDPLGRNLSHAVSRRSGTSRPCKRSYWTPPTPKRSWSNPKISCFVSLANPIPDRSSRRRTLAKFGTLTMFAFRPSAAIPFILIAFSNRFLTDPLKTMSADMRPARSKVRISCPRPTSSSSSTTTIIMGRSTSGSSIIIARRSIPAAQPTAGVCGPPSDSMRPS